jgi:hypothetical protein
VLAGGREVRAVLGDAAHVPALAGQFPVRGGQVEDVLAAAGKIEPARRVLGRGRELAGATGGGHPGAQQG